MDKGQDRKTDMTKLRVASRNFANARKNIPRFYHQETQTCELLGRDVIASSFIDSLESPKDLITSNLLYD